MSNDDRLIAVDEPIITYPRKGPTGLPNLRSAIDRIERLIMGRKAYKWVLKSWQQFDDLDAAAQVINTMRISSRIEPQESDGPRAERILVIAPHPDDELLGPGATLLRTAADGACIEIVYLTSGTADEAAQRRDEARGVCDAIGAAAVFLPFHSDAIDVGRATTALKERINAFAPQCVFLPFVLDDHPDHRLANRILLDAMMQLGDLPDVEIWAYQVYTALPANVVVDITDAVAEKRGLVERYRSQMQSRNWSHFAIGLNAFNCRFLSPRPDAAYAELFFVLPAADYAALLTIYHDALHKPESLSG